MIPFRRPRKPPRQPQHGLGLPGSARPTRTAIDLLAIIMLALWGVAMQFAGQVSVAFEQARPVQVASVSGTAASMPGLMRRPGDACPSDGHISVQRVRHVIINVYCGISAWQRQEIAKYTVEALDAMPAPIDPAVQIFAFVDLNDGIKVQYSWLKAHGYASVPYGPLREHWNAAAGQASMGAVFLYLNKHEYWSGTSAGIGIVVLHEMHHILQFELQGSDQGLALWLMEGAADSFAYSELYHRGLLDSAPPRNLPEDCSYPLQRLEYENASIPLDCRYVEGERAVTLLNSRFSASRYYALFQRAGSGRSFARVFENVYGLRLKEFYQGFEAYRDSDYRTVPVLGNRSPVRPPVKAV